MYKIAQRFAASLVNGKMIEELVALQWAWNFGVTLWMLAEKIKAIDCRVSDLNHSLG
jgi:hypothetical protein